MHFSYYSCLSADSVLPIATHWCIMEYTKDPGPREEDVTVMKIKDKVGVEQRGIKEI